MIKKEKQIQSEKPKMGKNNKILLIFVCIFLSVVLIFGSVFGIILAIEEANAVVKIGGVKMDEGIVRVISSYYKRLHIQGLLRAGYTDAEDDAEFWESLHENGKTQGQIYLESLRDYLAGIAAGCDLYSEIGSLKDADRELIGSRVDAFINYYGSKEKFNELASPFGFDFEDFRRAMELTYVSDLAFNAVYGFEGSALKAATPEAVAQCAEYLATYSRVRLIFLSNEKINEQNAEGEWVERDLTDGEKALRERYAEELRAAMAARESGGDGAITEQMFDIYLEKSDGDPEMKDVGYYFSETGDQTVKFAEYYPEVVKKSLEMKVGDYAEVDCRIGKCFIYKLTPEQNAYKDEENLFLSDFYSDAAVYLYTKAVETLSTEVVFKENYDKIDLLSIPVNDRLYVTSWK